MIIMSLKNKENGIEDKKELTKYFPPQVKSMDKEVLMRSSSATLNGLSIIEMISTKCSLKDL